MKKIIFILTLLMTNLYLFAQSNNEMGFNSKTTFTSFDNRSKDLEGTLFVNGDFEPVRFNNDEKKIYSVRYDGYHDEMQIKNDEGIFALPQKDNYIIHFINSGKEYKVYTSDGKKGFFKIVKSNNKVSLLIKEKIKFYDEEKPKSGYGKYKPPTLKRVKDIYFIGYQNNLALELPSSKKSVLKLFPSDKSSLVKSFIKTEKINLKKEKDLIKLIDYLNSII